MVTVVETVRSVPRGFGERQSVVWGLILDRVFADAAGSDVGTLRIIMPEGLFSEAVSLRRELVASVPGRRAAVAWLVAGVSRSLEAERTYTLMTWTKWVQAGRHGHGEANPDPGRRAGTAPDMWFVYPWDTWVLGGLMRLYGRLGRPDWQDRALFSLRARLVRSSATPCAYVLWAQDSPPAQEFGHGSEDGFTDSS